jgi:mono/diheme cytochrome c family protein
MKSLSCSLAVLIAIGLATLTAAPVSITLPPETGTYKAAAGAELAQANCLTCHSVEYVTSQPPMPRKFWEANVKKMKEKFGAPIADEQIAKIADYLTATYGVADKTAK